MRVLLPKALFSYEEDDMITVVGSTGLLGREICRILLKRGEAVRAFTRATSDQNIVNDLRKQGAEIVTGDLKDRASVDAACAGSSAVVSTASITFSRQPGDTIETVDRSGQITLVDAAKRAGVHKFVYVSFNHQRAPVRNPLADAKAAVENHLMNSGMDYTILRASYFMEVWLSPPLGFDAGNGKATIYGSGDQRISWISYRDVAAFAAESIRNGAMRNRVIEIGGPEAVTPKEVVRTFEKATGRRFDVQLVPEAALRAQLDAAADPLQQSFAALMLAYAAGDAVDMSATLRDVPVRPRSIREFAAELKSATAR